MPITRRSLNFDFVRDGSLGGQGFLDPLFTFSRASTATRVNASGLIETVAAGVPRFDFDFATLRCRGLLLEGARTNLCLHSGAWDNVAYAGIACVVTANSGTAPDGTMTAARYISGLRFQTVPVTVGLTYTVSLWARAVSGTANVGCYDVNGTSQPGVMVSTQWQRIIHTAVASSTQGFVGVNGTTGDVLLWGAQIEAGAFGTSYIPTTSAAVTRAADQCYITSLSPWWNHPEGTLILRAIATDIAPYTAILMTSDAGIGNPLRIMQGGEEGVQRVYFADENGAHDSWLPSLGAIARGQTFCTALRYGAGNAFAVHRDSAGLQQSTGAYALGRSVRVTLLAGVHQQLTYLPFALDDLSLTQSTL